MVKIHSTLHFHNGGRPPASLTPCIRSLSRSEAGAAFHREGGGVWSWMVLATSWVGDTLLKEVWGGSMAFMIVFLSVSSFTFACQPASIQASTALEPCWSLSGWMKLSMLLMFVILDSLAGRTNGGWVCWGWESLSQGSNGERASCFCSGNMHGHSSVFVDLFALVVGDLFAACCTCIEAHSIVCLALWILPGGSCWISGGLNTYLKCLLDPNLDKQSL